MKKQCFILGLLLCASPVIAAEPPIGEVFRLRGEMLIDGNRFKGEAGPGQKLYQGDTLVTLAQSKAELKMIDGTLIRLSEKSRFQLDQYQFNAAQSSRNVSLRQVKGYFRVLMGKLSQARAKNRFEVGTRLAVIGVKGTDFFAGPLSVGQMNIALFEGGPLEVKNSGGTLILKKAGEGVNIQTHKGMPAKAKQWPEKRLTLAKSKVDF